MVMFENPTPCDKRTIIKSNNNLFKIYQEQNAIMQILKDYDKNSPLIESDYPLTLFGRILFALVNRIWKMCFKNIKENEK